RERHGRHRLRSRRPRASADRVGEIGGARARCGDREQTARLNAGADVPVLQTGRGRPTARCTEWSCGVVVCLTSFEVESMRQWKIGDVAVQTIVETDLTGILDVVIPAATKAAVQQIRWLVPHFANDNGVMSGYIQAFAIRTPTQRIIVDTC